MVASPPTSSGKVASKTVSNVLEFSTARRNALLRPTISWVSHCPPLEHQLPVIVKKGIRDRGSRQLWQFAPACKFASRIEAKHHRSSGWLNQVQIAGRIRKQVRHVRLPAEMLLLFSSGGLCRRSFQDNLPDEFSAGVEFIKHLPGSNISTRRSSCSSISRHVPRSAGDNQLPRLNRLGKPEEPELTGDQKRRAARKYGCWRGAARSQCPLPRRVAGEDRSCPGETGESLEIGRKSGGPSRGGRKSDQSRQDRRRRCALPQPDAWRSRNSECLPGRFPPWQWPGIPGWRSAWPAARLQGCLRRARSESPPPSPSAPPRLRISGGPASPYQYSRSGPAVKRNS